MKFPICFFLCLIIFPNYAWAHSNRAVLNVWNAFQGWGGRNTEELERSLASANRALALDVNDAMAHFAAGFVQTMRRHSERAIEAQRTAIALNPKRRSATVRTVSMPGLVVMAEFISQRPAAPHC